MMGNKIISIVIGSLAAMGILGLLYWKFFAPDPQHQVYGYPPPGYAPPPPQAPDYKSD